MDTRGKFNLAFLGAFCVLAVVLYAVIFQADWGGADLETAVVRGIKPIAPGASPESMNAPSGASSGVPSGPVDFSLPDLSGRAVKLADYRGKVVVLNFWATWCAPCRAEIPSLVELNRGVAGKDVVLLTVAVNSGGRREIEAFYTQLGVSLPTLVDLDGKAYFAFGLTGVPETFILDRGGRIVQHYIGPRAWASPEFRAILDRILAAKAT
jgi:thiol-disulfide isomerase/thioredoxin